MSSARNSDPPPFISEQMEKRLRAEKLEEQISAQQKAWDDPFSTWNARNLVPKKD